MAWEIVVVGGANSDFAVQVERLPGPGETAAGRRFWESPGGKGANQAVAAARLGARAALIGRVGADERGERLAAALAREKVGCARLFRDPRAPTGAALVAVDARGRKAIAAFPGANGRLQLRELRAAAGDLRAARVVLAQLEVPLACVTEAALLCRAGGGRFLLDAAPAPRRPLPGALLRLCHLVRADASEARALTGLHPRDRAAARRAGRRLLRAGAQAACVGAGSAGDLLLWERGELWLPRIAVRAVDETGAGDALMGAFAAALAHGASLAEAGPFASAAAALATTRAGAQAGLPSRAEVLRLLRRYDLRLLRALNE